jgi:hypothetical protein
MNWQKKVEILAARARTEEPPHVDVVSNVMRILTSDQAEPYSVAERLWMWLAAGAAAVAVPAAIVAIMAYNAATTPGPLHEIVDSIAWAI